MIRFLFLFAIVVVLAVCGSTVKLGKRTFFGHVSAIWSSEEMEDAKEGIQEKAGPTVEKAKRAGKAAVDEMKKEEARDGGAR